MKTAGIVAIVGAAAIGLVVYLVSRRAKAVKEITGEEITKAVEERGPGETVSEAQKAIYQEVVKPGLTTEGVNINNALDCVGRQAGMLDQDIRTTVGRAISGVYSNQDLVTQVGWIADTYHLEVEAVWAMIDAERSKRNLSPVDPAIRKDAQLQAAASAAVNIASTHDISIGSAKKQIAKYGLEGATKRLSTISAFTAAKKAGFIGTLARFKKERRL